MVKDYRLSHMTERKRFKYDEIVYRANSYDDCMWRYEQQLLERLVKRFFPGKAKRYLDFGCGTGRIIAFLEGSVEEATGVDISEAMLAYARKRTRRAKLILADITVDDVLRGERFDFITAFRVFLNAGSELRDKCFAALVPKLKEKGVFIFNIHGNLWSYRLLTKIWYRMRGRRLNALSYWQIRKLAAAHGLRIVEWYGFGIVPKIFYRLPGPRAPFLLDKLLGHVPGLRYISYNIIFVCRKD